MVSILPALKNMKISVKFQPADINIFLKFVQNDIKRHGNFFVYRNRYVYTIFRSGHVNISALKSALDCHLAVQHVLSFLSNNIKVPTFIVDNCTYSGRFAKRVNLLHLKDALKDTTAVVTYKSCMFPGMCVKFKDEKGTLISFSTGAFCIIGVTNEKEAFNIFSLIGKIINGLQS